MTQEQYAAILELLSAKGDKDGWSVAGEGKTASLHVARSGASLTVSRVEALSVNGGTLRARTTKGEIYVLALDDIFAAGTEAAGAQSRRAGFGG